jgi:hypothetical protein
MEKIKSNLTYEDVSDTIEELIALKRRNWRIPSVDFNDVAQEIRIFVSKILNKYEDSRGNLRSFLSFCMDNFLRNYIRDQFFDFSPPCETANCIFFDKKKDACAANPEKCKRYIKYHINKENFARIRFALSIDTPYDGDEANSFKRVQNIGVRSNICENLDAVIIEEEVRKRLTLQQGKVYELLKLGYTIPEISKILNYANGGGTTRTHILNIGKTVKKVINELEDV